MLAALLVVSLLLALQTGYGLYYRRQVRQIGSQLDFIGRHDSFMLITTQLHTRELYRLAQSCNRLLQDRRAQNERHLQKNEAIHETIACLSHDIRTPLAALDGYLQLAEQEEHARDRGEQAASRVDYVRQARGRIKQMAKLVEELFLYTKLQNPDYKLELSTLDAAELLRHSLLAQVERISASGHEPELSLPEQALVVGETHAMRRVFDNVLTNYIDHGAGQLGIYAQESDRAWTFIFANVLPPDQTIDMERLFQRFYKADPARSGQTSGLGLTIVQSLMHRMRGTVTAELQDVHDLHNQRDHQDQHDQYDHQHDQHEQRRQDQQFCLRIEWPKRQDEEERRG